MDQPEIKLRPPHSDRPVTNAWHERDEKGIQNFFIKTRMEEVSFGEIWEQTRVQS